MEAMQSKGISNKMLEEERIENDRLRTRNIEIETRLRHMESVAEIKEKDALRVRDVYFIYRSLLSLSLSPQTFCALLSFFIYI